MTLPQHLPAAPDMLPAHVIDNHTHLGSTTEYSGLGVADSLTAAGMVGVAGVVDVGCDLPSSRAAAQLAATDPRVRAAVAIHPNDAARLFQRDGLAALDAELAELPALAALPGVVAVGETGLDYYRTRDAEAQRVQAHSFRFHIALARENNLTLVIHDRDAHADVLKVLDSVESPERVVMHCFSGDADFARECVDR
ncbi:TatD family hydrolase, partial [Arachnia propionica]